MFFKLQHFEDAAEEGEEASKPDRTYLVGRVALRTLFYDDHLLAAVKGGAIRQVVLLGAGMDSRAWRLDLPKGICAPPYLDLTKPVITVTKTGPFPAEGCGAEDMNSCACRAGVAWFEIDRADVLNAKTKVLTSARAAFSLDANKGAK